MTTRIAIAISLLCLLALCFNLNAQAGSDVADQIKQMQQESRDAQMKNDASWRATRQKLRNRGRGGREGGC